MRIMQILIGSIFAIAVMMGCGYMIYFLTLITFLPVWMHNVLIILCGIAIIITLYVWITSVIASFRKSED